MLWSDSMDAKVKSLGTAEQDRCPNECYGANQDMINKRLQRDQLDHAKIGDEK